MSKGSLHQEIAEMAYSLYEKRGRKPGHQEQDWLEAEKIVQERRKAQDGNGSPAKAPRKKAAAAASSGVKTSSRTSAAKPKKASRKKEEV